MTGWLLDTNILPELRRPKPHRKVVAFVAEQPLERLYISSVTLAEIRFGIELVTDATKRAELTNWLANEVRPLFEQRVLRVGHTFSQPDLIIAATAFQHGMTVVSRDTSEYEKAGVQVLNPWTS